MEKKRQMGRENYFEKWADHERQLDEARKMQRWKYWKGKMGQIHDKRNADKNEL